MEQESEPPYPAEEGIDSIFLKKNATYQIVSGNACSDIALEQPCVATAPDVVTLSGDSGGIEGNPDFG
jgi:hypothetical protein